MCILKFIIIIFHLHYILASKTYNILLERYQLFFIKRLQNVLNILYYTN